MGDVARAAAKPRSFGIGATLYSATGVLILLIVAAAGLAVVAFANVERTLSTVTEDAFPAVTDGLRLTTLSERVAAKAPELIRATDAAERSAVAGSIDAAFADIRATLARIEMKDADKGAALGGTVDTLQSRMGELGEAIDRREAARSDLQALRVKVLSAHADFLAEMTPLIEDENFNLVLSGGDTVNKAVRTINELITVHVAGLQATLTTALHSERLITAMTRGLTRTSQTALAGERERFDAIAEELLSGLDALPQTEEGEVLADAASAIVEQGRAERSPFDIRAQELAGESNAVFRLVADGQLLNLATQYERAVDPVLEQAEISLREEGKRLSDELKGDINTLVDDDIFALTQTMFLLSEANMVAGILNAAASSPTLEELAENEAAFRDSSYRLNTYTVDLEFLGKGESVIGLAKALVAFGEGDGSLFAVRRGLLEQEAAAQTALETARTAAGELDRAVESSVAASEAEVDRRTAETIASLRQTETLLFALAGIGAAVGILIAWLVVYRRVVRRLLELSRQMATLAAGDNSVTPDTSGSDEISGMAGTVVVFRDNAKEVERLRKEQIASEERAKQEAQRQRDALADRFETQVKEIVKRLAESVGEMERNAHLMTDGASDVQSRSNSGAAAAEATAGNVQAMAAAVEELSASIGEISGKVAESSQMAQSAADRADQTNQSMQGLEAAASRIDSVVTLIQEIAEQTNLLALNATIEAARAGDAGKGFAVVASEVKSLASQTASATDEITQQIKTLQTGVAEAVVAIKEVSGSIQDIGGHVTSIAGAVEQQNASTEEIARSSRDAAMGTTRVSETVGSLSDVATNAEQQAGAVLDAARSLARETRDLEQALDVFLGGIRKGA